MNILQLKDILEEIDMQAGNAKLTSVVLSNGKIIIHNTGQNYDEPLRWEIDAPPHDSSKCLLRTVTEKEIKAARSE